MKAVNIFLNSEKGRARYILWFGFFFNLIYSVWGFFTGVFYRSAWMLSVAVYYILLCLLKFFMIRADLRFRESDKGAKARLRAFECYKRCGYLLGLLSITMVGIVIFIISRDESAKYSGVVFWIMGGYTAIRLGVSFYNLFRLKNIDDPLLSASKSLGISVTLMSVFSLTTALLARFCADTAVRRSIIASVGFSVSVAVIMVAAYMISRGRKKLHKTMNK